MDIDFSELFTQSVQQIVPATQRKGLVFSFDYRGPRVEFAALVVDDNAVNRLVATGLLQALGFEVETANDGTDAVEACRRGAPDFVLMDIRMPGMDGLEATRRLRALQRDGSLPPFPIVAATASVIDA